MPAPPPLVADVDEPLADRHRHPGRPRGVVVLECGIVEEDHDPVAGEVLQRPLVLHHQRPHRRVVAAEEAEHLLRLSRLGERREVAQVAEHRGDLAPVAGEERLALGARDQLRDLRREEPCQLAALALDRLEEPRIGDPDRRLLGEADGERPLAIAERPDLVAGQGQDAANRPVLLDRDADQGPVSADMLARGRLVLAVVENVVDADHLADQGDPSDQAVAAGPDRVVPLPGVQLRRPAGRRGHPIGVAVQGIGDAVVGPAEADGCPDDGVEDDLEVERGAAHDRQDLVRRGLPVDGLALGVVEPLPRERRRDPRLEDRRIDRLRQVVRRAHLEAPDDAVQLVDAGDHDHRQVAQGRVVAELGEHLVAVHLRHDDVKEDHVDRRNIRVAQTGEGLAAVLGLHRLVAEAPQQPRQELAVERRVVDDEDAARETRAVAARRGHARPPAIAGRTFAIAASSSSGRIGLLT